MSADGKVTARVSKGEVTGRVEQFTKAEQQLLDAIHQEIRQTC